MHDICCCKKCGKWDYVNNPREALCEKCQPPPEPELGQMMLIGYMDETLRKKGDAA